MVITTLIVLGLTILVLLSGKIRPDLVAMSAALVLGISGVLTVQEVFSGFSRSEVITIMAVFILADGLRRVGVTERVGGWLYWLAGAKEGWLIVATMLIGAGLSLFMNNIAAASILLPAVMGVARKSNVKPSRLLMPMAFGTLLGGMATLFTSSNLVVSSILREQGYRAYGIFDFAPLGLPLVAVGIVYMVLIGRRLLPAHESRLAMGSAGQYEGDLTAVYRLQERLVRGSVQPDSKLINVPLAKSGLRELYRLNLVAIERDGHLLINPSPENQIKLGDNLLLEGRQEDISQPGVQSILAFSAVNQPPELQNENIMLAEAVLSPRSDYIGHTLREIHFREKYDMHAIGVWRAGRPIRARLSELPLQFGDALLLLGPRKRLTMLNREANLILLDQVESAVTRVSWKFWLGLVVMISAILVVSLSNLPIAEVMFVGALAMILLGILSMEQALAAIDWKSIFVIVGVFPLGIALTKTGLALSLADAIVSLSNPAGTIALLAGLVLMSILMVQVMNGTAVAAVMAPIAISAAVYAGIDPRALAMGVVLGTSITFITPLGHPVNILIMEPGGYSFRDYLKVGLLLTLILILMIIILLPLIWPL